MFFCFIHVMHTPQINLIGASTRASAAMCRRAGLIPACYDQYADIDLHEIAGEVTQIHFDVQALPSFDAQAWSQQTLNLPWFYTGPIENQPDWVEAVESRTTLWGNSASVIRKVRSPWLLSQLCRDYESTIHFPETLNMRETNLRRSRDWLWKPLDSAGGWTIQKARKSLSERPESRVRQNLSNGYWQKRVPGAGFGITIASDGEKAVPIGGCRSFRGVNGRPFAYCGSAGPVRDRFFQKFIAGLGPLLGHLVETTRIKGLWNMDVVYEPRQNLWYLMEINPRISASMEVLELIAGQSLLQIHLAIFRNDLNWTELAFEFIDGLNKSQKHVKKSIIYSVVPCRPVDIRRHRKFVRPFELWPEASFIADFPATDSKIPAGMPLWTTIQINNS